MGLGARARDELLAERFVPLTQMSPLCKAYLFWPVGPKTNRILGPAKHVLALDRGQVYLGNRLWAQ